MDPCLSWYEFSSRQGNGNSFNSATVAELVSQVHTLSHGRLFCGIVAEQFGNIQIDGQNLIDLQPMKLLYIASKSTTPPEIRKRVETLDITTHKQYREALSEIRARDAKIEDLLEMSEAADRRAEEAERKRKEANEGYSAAMETLRQAQEEQRAKARPTERARAPIPSRPHRQATSLALTSYVCTCARTGRLILRVV